MIRKWKLLLCTVLFAFCSITANAQMATFDSTSNVLTLKLLKFGNDYYTGTKVYLAPNGVWTLQTIGASASAMSSSEPAVYNNSDSTVRLPYVLVSGSLFNNLVLSLPLDGRPWAVNDAGNVITTATSGEEISYPIVSSVPNSYSAVALLVLANGQTWRSEAAGDCFNETMKKALDQSSDVLIYPSSSAGKFNMDLTFKNTLASCTVSPVSGFPVNPSGADLQVSPNTITAMVAETADIYVTGGTPPYFATADMPNIISYAFQPRSAGEPGQTLRVYMKSVGSATLSVYDYIAAKASPVTVTVEDNPSLGPPEFWVNPASVELDVGPSNQFSAMLYGGVPPYKLFFNPTPTNVIVEPFNGNQSPTRLNIILQKTVNMGDVTTFLQFEDSVGQIATMKIEISGAGGIFK